MQLQHIRTARSETFPFEERTLRLGDTHLRYFDHGTGPAIVFIHGLGANLTHFEYIAPALRADGFRVCGLDLPGFGLSGRPRRTYTVEYLADSVTALMDHLGIGRATLCGHSLGGMLAADIALNKPSRVDSLLMLSPAGLFKMPALVQLAARNAVAPSLLARAVEKNAAWLIDHIFGEQNERTRRFRDQALLRYDPSYVPDMVRSVHAARRDLTRYHLLDKAHKLSMPTLVVWGGRDRLLPGRAVPSFARALPRGSLAWMSRCGHMPLIEDPELLLGHIRTFQSREGVTAIELGARDALERAQPLRPIAPAIITP